MNINPFFSSIYTLIRKRCRINRFLEKKQRYIHGKYSRNECLYSATHPVRFSKGWGTLFFVWSLLITPHVFAHNKTIAITLDDLPFVGEARNFHLNMIIDTMKEHHVPITGFIIGKEVHSENWEMLQKFKDAGFGLGNHTFSHANLNQLHAHDYMQDIKKADDALTSVLTKPKYFRYPYLAMSSGAKRNEILCFLAQNDYEVAPITIDSKDFVFNQRLLSVPEIDRRAYLEVLKPFYLDFIATQTQKAEEHTQYHHRPEQAQILLVHANLLNAYVFPDIINLYKKNGYTFVTLEEALKTFKDPIHCASAQKNTLKKTQVAQNNLNTDDFLAWD